MLDETGENTMQFVPGIPTKRYNPCVDPQQGLIPHIVRIVRVRNGMVDTDMSNELKPNHEHYLEWAYLIQQFIDSGGW